MAGPDKNKNNRAASAKSTRAAAATVEAKTAEEYSLATEDEREWEALPEDAEEDLPEGGSGENFEDEAREDEAGGDWDDPDEIDDGPDANPPRRGNGNGGNDGGGNGGGGDYPPDDENQQTNGNGGNGGGSGGDGPMDPREKLKEIERKLNEQQQRLKELGDANKRCSQERDWLNDIIKEVEGVLSGYEKSLEPCKKKKKDLAYYAKKKTEMVEHLVKEKIKDIKKIVDDICKNIDTLEKRQKGYEHHLKRTGENLENAKKSKADKQAHYDAATKRKADIDAKLKEMERLRVEIEKEEETCDYALMYYYLTEMNRLLLETDSDLIPVEKYRKMLYDCWYQIDVEDFKLQKAEKEHQESERRIIKGEKDLAEARKNKKQNIIDQLREIEI